MNAQQEDQLENQPNEAEALEAEARASRWKPKEEWRGPEEAWVDAKTWVETQRKLKPLVELNNKNLKNELNKLRQELQDAKLTISEFGQLYGKMTEAAYKRAIEEVKGQLREARKEDDPDRVDALQEQIDNLKEASKNIQIPKVRESNSSAGLQVLNEWASENTWWNEKTNPRLYFAADGIAKALSNEKPHLIGTRDFLDEMHRRVKELLPDEFKPRSKASMVDGSSESRSTVGRTPGKKTYAMLPPEAKAACDRMTDPKRAGYIPGYTKEKYVETYFEGEE